MGGERGPMQLQHVELKPLVYVAFGRQPRGRVDSRPHIGRLQSRTLSLLRDALPGR